jgi:hypothetical protein
LNHSRLSDCAKDGDRLAAEIRHRHGNLGILHVLLEAGVQLRFELFNREAAGLDPSNERQRNVSVHANQEGLLGNFRGVDGVDHNLVIRPEDIPGIEFLGGLRDLLGGGAQGE